MKEILVGKIQRPFLRHVSPASLLDNSDGKNFQRILVDESGMIKMYGHEPQEGVRY
jgi:hypothetical protein